MHIEQDWTLGTERVDSTAWGVAVDLVLGCSTGTADDPGIASSGPEGRTLSIPLVLKRFPCCVLSGTFDIALTVQLDNVTHYTTASWRIIGGTDSYADLHGRGLLAGTPTEPGVSIRDVYDGTVQ